MEKWTTFCIQFMLIIFLVSPNTFISSTAAEQNEKKTNEVYLYSHIEIIGREKFKKHQNNSN